MNYLAFMTLVQIVATVFLALMGVDVAVVLASGFSSVAMAVLAHAESADR